MRLFSQITLAAALGALLVACGSDAAGTDGAQSNAASTATDAEKLAIDWPAAAHVLETDMVLGSADAPITFIEYASVTCPHCATFHETILPEIQKDYIDTGKVRFVFREFPTAPAKFALIGSVIARCAGEKDGPDAYFLVLGSLLKGQKTWIYGDDPETELLKIAGQAGMDKDAMYTCLKRQEFVDLIEENTKAATEAFDVRGTPAFVVNGEKRALRTAEDFRRTFDEILGEGGGDAGDVADG